MQINFVKRNTRLRARSMREKQKQDERANEQDLDPVFVRHVEHCADERNDDDERSEDCREDRIEKSPVQKGGSPFDVF